MIEVPGKAAEARRLGAQLQDEIAQFRRRHERLDIVPVGLCLTFGIAKNLSAPAAE